MLTLFHSSGAQDYELLDLVYSNDEWLKVKNRIIKMLVAKGLNDARNIFEEYDFSFYSATNGFGDEFNVLYTEVSIEEYVQLEESQSYLLNRDEFSEIASASTKVADYTRFIAVGIKTDDEIEPVKSPEPGISSTIVEIALRDAENLIKSSGAISAVDRVHTALHGYFKAVCINSNINFNENANLITLWGLIRQSHSVFNNSTNKNDDIMKMLRNISNILDSLNNIRNKSSIAHPNEELLSESEAMFAINCARSILHYLDSVI